MAREKLKKIKVEEFTSPSPITAERKSRLEDLRLLMTQEGIRHIPVVENDQPVGIISDRDLGLAISIYDSTGLLAEDIMSPEPFTVSLEADIDEVAYQMSKSKIGSAIVLDTSGKIFGIFTSTDALNALVEVIRGDV